MQFSIHSNAPWTGTGYGTQTDLMRRVFQTLGHKVLVSGFYGVQGAPIQDGDVLILPTSKDAYGNDVLMEDFRFHNLDFILTLIDAWIFNPAVLEQIRAVLYFPVDCDPLPPGDMNALRAAWKRIAYSQFGVEASRKAGFTDVLYAPHIVDTTAFAPMDKIEARRALGMDGSRLDWFLVTTVAANKGNPSRKSFDQQIRAFAEFHKRVPNSMYALHTDMWGGYDGENIERIVQLAGLTMDVIAAPPKYQFIRGMLGQDYLRKLYNASDALLNATRGEGFGVPIIEAMACGVPAIVGDYTSMPELVDAGAGWKVPYSDRFFYKNSYQFTPSVDGIVKALEQAYDARNDQAMKDKARAGVVGHYDAAMVAETYWKPILEQFAVELDSLNAKKAERAAKRATLRANGQKAPEAVIG